MPAYPLDVLVVLDESHQYVAYCPALQLSSYGDTPAEARAAFAEVLALWASEATARALAANGVELAVVERYTLSIELKSPAS